MPLGPIGIGLRDNGRQSGDCTKHNTKATSASRMPQRKINFRDLTQNF